MTQKTVIARINMTDTREAFKPADNYEGLLIQAKALHRLSVSYEAMLNHYMAIDYSLSDAKMNELTECLESEKQMNHVLTNENESYKERIAELEKDANYIQDMFVKGYQLSYNAPVDWLTDEANKRFAWQVVRTIKPFCDAESNRAWVGSTPKEAIENCKNAIDKSIA